MFDQDNNSHATESGFTLIELIAVVVLLAILSAFFVGRFTFSSGWSTDGALRELRSRLEFIIQDSVTRNINYQFEFDINSNSYRFWEILPPDPSVSQEVDTLSGLRTRKEKERRRNRSDIEAVFSIDNELRLKELNNSRPLDELFYQKIFNDPYAPGRRIPPLEYPSLFDIVTLPSEISFERATFDENEISRTINDGLIIITFSPGVLDFNELKLYFRTDKGPASVSVIPFDMSVRVMYLGI
ncbi:MAG TPA: type II secretion system protein [Oligoflexia bacterium]|nr:type II secretion system protein [Oligoflexia bacterium]HMP47932.1 type II secretion system protein [Oligoflexia bacterium]